MAMAVDADIRATIIAIALLMSDIDTPTGDTLIEDIRI